MRLDKDIKIKLVLEGKEFSGDIMPVKRVDIVNAPGIPPHAILDMVPTDIYLRRRTMGYIYYKDGNVWRLLFKGEVTGRGHNKMAEMNQKPLYMTMPINYLNDMPAIYATLMTENAYVQEHHKFFGIPDGIAADIAFIPELSEFDVDMTLSKFVDMFFERIIGDKGWDKYYQNANRRYKIQDSHILIDSGRFNYEYEREIMYKAVVNLVNQAARIEQRMLDDIIKNLRTTGYSYINLNTPAFNKVSKKMPSTRNFNEVAINKSGNNLMEYIMFPDPMNTYPPWCNVIYVMKNDRLSVNIQENTITRLRNEYMWVDYAMSPIEDIYESADKVLTAMYPTHLTNEFKMQPDEYDNGVIGLIQNKNAVNALLRASDISSFEGDDAIQRFINNETAVEFYHVKYARNSCNVAKLGFNPYVVAGLPAIVVDVESKSFYYGNVTRVTSSVNTETGNTSVSIDMDHVREIKHICEISKDIDENGELVRSFKHPLAPDFYDPIRPVRTEDGLTYTVTRNPDRLTKMTDEIYRNILGDNPEYNGWKCVLEVPEGVTVDMMLDYIWRQHRNEEQFCRRPIATEHETLVPLIGDPLPDESPHNWRKIDGQIALESLSKELLDTKKKKFLVKERRDIVNKYAELLKNNLLR